MPVRDRKEVLDPLDGIGIVSRVPAADAEAEGDGPEHVPAGGARSFLGIGPGSLSGYESKDMEVVGFEGETEG